MLRSEPDSDEPAGLSAVCGVALGCLLLGRVEKPPDDVLAHLSVRDLKRWAPAMR